MINLVKASAGSGKTFLLAKTYISLILKSPNRFAYRNILAITFTNKATSEMKARVIKELYTLANSPADSAYFDYFLSQNMDEKWLIKRAGTLLKDMLHDYSAFSISTIDSFFQRTLKAFAHEIGQFYNYQLDLDKSNLIAEAVDRIMDSVSEDNLELFDWIKQSALDYIAINETFKVDAGLNEIAEAVLSEEFNAILKKHNLDIEQLYSKEALLHLRSNLNDYIDSYISLIKKTASCVKKEFEKAGIELSDTNRSFMAKTLNVIEALKPADRIDLGSFMKYTLDLNTWFPKKNAKLTDLVSLELEEAVSRLRSLYEDKPKYNTALIVRKQIFSLGLIKEVYESFNSLIKEKNIISLDDSNDIINKIINNTDAPFIYEKLGVRYEHFLLDEFQDTSLIQWDNLKPLIRESVANCRDNLIVGDIKQSIYRFRGGDWSLLDSVVNKEFAEYIDLQSLKTNWRSSRRVIEFNNDIFAFLKRELSRVLPAGENVLRIYDDLEQKYPDNKIVPETFWGNVRMDFTDDLLRETHFAIESIRKQGAKYGQIAILVRTKKMGAAIADILTKFKIPFISEDSLFIKSSDMIRNIISLLSLADNPDDSIYKYKATQLNVSLPSRYNSIIDLCEYLIRSLSVGEDMEKHLAYLQAFMDVVKEWTDRNGNNLSAFIKYWDNVNPKIPGPESLDALTIITVHKSKGLEYDYVICPIKQQKLIEDEEIWAFTDDQEDALNIFSSRLFHVSLNKDSANTLFKEAYEQNVFLQGVDLLNMAYVAFTRASKTLHIISENVSNSFLSRYEKAPEELSYSYLHQLLYAYVHSRDKELSFEKLEDEALYDEFVQEYYAEKASENNRSSYIYGNMYPYGLENKQRKKGLDYKKEMNIDYASFAVYGIEKENQIADRISFTSEYDDFFAQKEVGIEASHRLRGVILHKILSYVIVCKDVPAAVRTMQNTGFITAVQAYELQEYLEKAIDSVKEYGWFDESKEGIFNELEVFDEQGNSYRPDRLIIRGGKLCIVDYKFGKEQLKYDKQLIRYANLFKSMDYEEVEAYLWYVDKLEANVKKVV